MAAKNIPPLLQRIHQAALSVGRSPDNIHLLAVSKTQPAGVVREACLTGLHDFGENYLQEALGKQRRLSDLPITWHFIGPIQSNKTEAIAAHFSWVHSVDRLKIAHRLSNQRPIHLPPLNICLQINISGETSKFGCSPGEALELAQEVARLPRLKLRGLMTIPHPESDHEQQRIPFHALNQLLQQLNGILPQPLDTLSMGMSDDLEAAVAEGATWVRIGTALFGARHSSHSIEENE